MTRRERHLNIIRSFGEWHNYRRSYINHAFERLMAKRGFNNLTDEAVEELARILLDERAFSKVINERNRKLRAAS